MGYDVSKETVDEFMAGGVEVGTSAVRCSTNTNKLAKGVQLRASPENDGIIFVGHGQHVTPGDVTATDGFPLAAGEGVFLPISSADKVWLISDTAAQKVFLLAI
jgi:hypothetical protein